MARLTNSSQYCQVVLNIVLLLFRTNEGENQRVVHTVHEQSHCILMDSV